MLHPLLSPVGKLVLGMVQVYRALFHLFAVYCFLYMEGRGVNSGLQMEVSTALAIVEINDTITTVLEPKTRPIWISLLGSHLNAVITCTCITRLSLG